MGDDGTAGGSGGGERRYQANFVANITRDGHTEYHIKVTDPDGDNWVIKKRYREFRELDEQLRLKYKAERLPQIPGRRLFGNQDPAFVKARQTGLQQYLEGVLRLEPGIGRTRLLQQFLQAQDRKNRPRAGAGAPNQQQILERAQMALFDLAQSPSSLDPMEIEQRVKKYGRVLRTHVLTQPIDPIHLQEQNVGEPVMPRLCPSNGERLENLLTAPSIAIEQNDPQLLAGLFDVLGKKLSTDRKIADPNQLIVPFPPLDAATQPVTRPE